MLHHVWEQMGRVKIIWNFVKNPTLPETTISPENGLLEDEVSFQDGLFSRAIWVLGSVLLVELLVIPKFLNSWDSLWIWNAQFGPMGSWQHRGWINQHISSHGFPTHHIIESSAVNTNITSSSARSGRNRQALVKIYSDGVFWQDAELPQSNVFFSRWRCWKDTQTSKTLRESYLVTPASWMEWMWDTATDGK